MGLDGKVVGHLALRGPRPLCGKSGTSGTRKRWGYVVPSQGQAGQATIVQTPNVQKHRSREQHKLGKHSSPGHRTPREVFCKTVAVLASYFLVNLGFCSGAGLSRTRNYVTKAPCFFSQPPAARLGPLLLSYPRQLRGNKLGYRSGQKP